VRLDGCGVVIENVYIPAGGDEPDRTINPKFGQKLDFLERMTQWAEGLKDDHLGDFNIAPLKAMCGATRRCSRWSATRRSRSRRWRVPGRARLCGHRPPVDRGARTLLFLVVVPRQGLARERQGAPAGPYLGLARRGGAGAHRVLEDARNWEKCSDHVPLITSSTSDAAFPPVALALDALRHGWALRIGGQVLLPAETGFAPGVSARAMLISAARAAALKLANQRDAARPKRRC
jgi:hypothetical protein